MKTLLEITDLSISIGGKPILKGINLTVSAQDTMILFGPNGSGKSTLLRAIMGLGGFSVTGGDIVFKGKRLNDLPIEERVRSGLGVMYQHPPAIRGVRLRQIARFLCADEAKIGQLASRLFLCDHLDRDVNAGFSGGEMKRAELFQLLLQDPDLILLDEPESGVDLENIGIMGKALGEYLAAPGKSAFIITHTGYILDYVAAAHGCVMLAGEFHCVGDPKKMFADIKQSGYENCTVCTCPQKS